VEAHAIDPRDATAQSWSPSYRVELWSRADPARPDSGWVCDTWRLTSAVDVEEALGWVRERSDAATATLYAELRAGDGAITLMRLLGDDPTRADEQPC
jgi:hypothetical protein